MTIQFSKYTPEEPNWEQEITRLRACADITDPLRVDEATDTIFKFSTTRADNVEEILCRVRDANDKVGTPAANQIGRDTIQRSVDYLQRIGYAQGTIVSWAIPGVYPIWSAYRKDSARGFEYRVAIWLTLLRDPADVTCLIGDRERTPGRMFFRRQHVVRACHARSLVRSEITTTVGDTSLRAIMTDDPYPDWVDEQTIAICQAVDYDIAEDLACTDDVDTWIGVMNDNRVSRHVQGLAMQAAKRYSDDQIRKLNKL